MNSGGSAPADVGGEPPNGRAKGQRASSRNRMFRGPLKRRSIRPSSRMPTTRQRAGFETGTHSSSPLQGAITRGAPHVAQRIRTEGHHTASQKREKKMSARHAEPRCLGPKPRLCGWKKSRPGRMCRSWGPKKPSAAKRDQNGIACLDGPSEIKSQVARLKWRVLRPTCVNVWSE